MYGKKLIDKNVMNKKRRKRRTIRGIQIANGKAKKAKERNLDYDRKYRSRDNLLRNFYRLLIEPLLRKRPERHERHGWLEEMWATAVHPIKKYKVIRKFQLPVVPVSYYGKEIFFNKNYYTVANTTAWVRFNREDSVDVEVKTNTVNYYVFNLSPSQWYEVENNFKEIK